MKKHLVLILAFLLTLLTVGCTGFQDEEAVKLIDHGFIVDIDQSGHRLLVTEKWEGNGQQPQAAWLKVHEGTSITGPNQKNILFQDLRTGLSVEVWNLGPVAESYPVQAEAAKIVVKNDGEESIAVSKALAHLKGTELRFIQQVSFDQEKGVWTVKISELGSTQVLHVNLQTGKVTEPSTTQKPEPQPQKPKPEPQNKPDSEQPKPEENPPAPSKPDIVAENGAFRIFEPAPDTVVGKTLVVRGEARVFEAVLSYSLEDGHRVLAEGHVMASQGAPEWGSFEIKINVDQVTSPSGVLTIYEASAKDGSPIHVLNIPVKFEEEIIER